MLVLAGCGTVGREHDRVVEEVARPVARQEARKVLAEEGPTMVITTVDSHLWGLVKKYGFISLGGALTYFFGSKSGRNKLRGIFNGQAEEAFQRAKALRDKDKEKYERGT